MVSGRILEWMRPLRGKFFHERGEVTIQLEPEEFVKIQQMEVAVNGPDGATHLILCTGVGDVCPIYNSTYAFFVSPRISRRQFAGAVATGALPPVH